MTPKAVALAGKAINDVYGRVIGFSAFVTNDQDPVAALHCETGVRRSLCYQESATGDTGGRGSADPANNRPGYVNVAALIRG